MENFDWQGLYRFASEQAILGVVFEGVKRLGGQGVKPPFRLLLEWAAMVDQIERRNRQVDEAAAKLVAELDEDGFSSCILKGQGNALLYPNPKVRISGDIDVWVWPSRMVCSEQTMIGRGIREIVKYVKKRIPYARAIYHHIDYGSIDDIEVEVHYRPSFMFHPVHNGRLQQWFDHNAKEQFRHFAELPDNVGSVAVPNTDFNIVFQLSHIYNHLLHEGIGLRQLIDYYYLLKTQNPPVSGNWKKTLKSLGMWKIAKALMWVMHEELGLDGKYLIAPTDERLGRMMLDEILRGGNFGKYDEANVQADTQLKKNLQRIRRDFRMLRYFPSECLFEPVFRVYHFFWRQWYN